MKARALHCVQYAFLILHLIANFSCSHRMKIVPGQSLGKCRHVERFLRSQFTRDDVASSPYYNSALEINKTVVYRCSRDSRQRSERDEDLRVRVKCCFVDTSEVQGSGGSGMRIFISNGNLLRTLFTRSKCLSGSAIRHEVRRIGVGAINPTAEFLGIVEN